ncbi:phosphomethylpyrimidine synthase [Candidatus Magnetobacterium bavaricum]|uniref:Phosphomethylpyrimidine synthase n=1 Tax=Candidatus Magnetobacterium bavaricum TaxID=29290 RepID=A0A0F3GS99_9BACT|nr:phosphomethylpyrimidine synthase [Candidatus Magnetobacterium bavaricum]
MITRIDEARKGIITEEVRQVAIAERVSPEMISADISNGYTVVSRNPIRNIKPLGIGKGLTTKINANIGTSKDHVSVEEELTKLSMLVKYGSDAVMDLSTGGPIRELRRSLTEKSPVSIGTVPIYEAAVATIERHGNIFKMTADDLFDVIELQAQEGVDFVTVHCGLTLSAIDHLRQQRRELDIVSRGGSIMLEWMVYNNKENPLYEQYDRLLELARRYDLTLSLGDGLRPGCLADATDRAQVQELITLGKLQKTALEYGVQSIIEGPGHVPLHQVEMNIKLQKSLCSGAPFYVLGPLVTDVGVGYDHITSAIGGAIAGAAGADFLCYVTPSEHVRLPDIDDVIEGVIASKIAAHAADISKGIKSAIDRDLQMARYRKKLDWEGQISLSFNPDKVRAMRSHIPPAQSEVCSMCADFCAIKTVQRALYG